ncbi:hypothetical protein K435DRAFT_831519 [Dendrothele bispora CBS 962.96]|uniref:Mitochondrial carrier n=1 Tax=Dendrothele bispora (strain CBS 962.96) TaxID=1314807 RepID=A0A4S8L4I2_DENBC|nr:hypothetical protein K435DRAFT_831519 [Dendrothele bispora CBS 962.96]
MNFFLAAISVPFSGVLVRYRANYAPKGIQLDGEPASTNGPDVRGYFAMMKRVYKLEGWAGLYKGLMPVLITPIIGLLFGLSISFALLKATLPSLPTPVSQVLFILFSSIIINIPLSIIINRAICTPYVLPYFSLKTAFGVLLTPTERHRPWNLYLTPGLIFANFLTAFIVFFTKVIFVIAMSAIPLDKVGFDPLFLSISLGAVIMLFSSALISPLQVMAMRLTLQRNHGKKIKEESDGQPQTQDEQAAKLELKAYSLDVDVMGFRDELDPYTSLYNCFIRVKQEEGWRVFYRAFWVTVLLQIGVVLTTPTGQI